MESKKIDGGAGVGEQRAGDWEEEEEQYGERWGGARGGRAVNLRVQGVGGPSQHSLNSKSTQNACT